MKGIKKLTDERLIIRNLKNIRIVFVLQTLGIVGILIYKAIMNGISDILGSPLWYVLMISLIVGAYLNLTIAVDSEEQQQNEQMSYPKKVLLALGIGIIISLLLIFTSDNPVWSSALIGAVFFLCFLAPITYTHFLKKKWSDDDEK